MNDQTYQSQPGSHALAVLSLVLGILGLTPVLPLIGSIAAIVTGMIARRDILAKPHEYSGESMARAGIILGWIGVVLLVLVACAALLFLVTFSVRTS
jgi:membrane-associated protease RseP (regulator of RpoE activity)